MPSTKLAEQAYQTLLEIVVRDHVFGPSERDYGELLTEGARERIATHAQIDVRTRLCLISGKGGWSADPVTFRRREQFTNVTLLDHLVSVVRGALVIAETDLRSEGVSEPDLIQRLAVIAGVAFLHDANKMLELPPGVALTLDHIQTVVTRYGVDKYLNAFSTRFPPALFLQAIEEVEVSHCDRLRPGEPMLTREGKKDLLYVRLADRLDAAFLNSAKSDADIIAELANKAMLRNQQSDFFKGWRFIRISDPHTPFLMDAFLSALSFACADPIAGHGHPPLISIHHDGRLLCVIPAERSDELIAQALSESDPLPDQQYVRVQA